MAKPKQFPCRLAVHLTPETLAAITSRAEAAGRSLAEEIREALRAWVGRETE